MTLRFPPAHPWAPGGGQQCSLTLVQKARARRSRELGSPCSRVSSTRSLLAGLSAVHQCECRHIGPFPSEHSYEYHICAERKQSSFSNPPHLGPYYQGGKLLPHSLKKTSPLVCKKGLLLPRAAEQGGNGVKAQCAVGTMLPEPQQWESFCTAILCSPRPGSYTLGISSFSLCQEGCQFLYLHSRQVWAWSCSCSLCVPVMMHYAPLLAWPVMMSLWRTVPRILHREEWGTVPGVYLSVSSLCLL